MRDNRRLDFGDDMRDHIWHRHFGSNHFCSALQSFCLGFLTQALSVPLPRSFHFQFVYVCSAAFLLSPATFFIVQGLWHNVRTLFLCVTVEDGVESGRAGTWHMIWASCPHWPRPYNRDNKNPGPVSCIQYVVCESTTGQDVTADIFQSYSLWDWIVTRSSDILLGLYNA